MANTKPKNVIIKLKKHDNKLCSTFYELIFIAVNILLFVFNTEVSPVHQHQIIPEESTFGFRPHDTD